MANSAAVSAPGHARRLGNASIGLSVAGIVATVVVIIIVVVAVTSASCKYIYYGRCYGDRDYVGYYGYCSGRRVSVYCYYD